MTLFPRPNGSEDVKKTSKQYHEIRKVRKPEIKFLWEPNILLLFRDFMFSGFRDLI
jgi:hypothetical protein